MVSLKELLYVCVLSAAGSTNLIVHFTCYAPHTTITVFKRQWY